VKKVLLDKTFPHFDEPLRRELDLLGDICLFKRGEMVVAQGALLPHTFIVLSGCIKVCRGKDADKAFVVTYLTPGNSFGVSVSEDSVLASKYSLMSFSATEPAYLLTIGFNHKDQLAKNFDQWYKYILRTSVTYYKFYAELIDVIAFKKLDEKILYFLQRFAAANQSPTITLNHQEIAESLHASRESVTRMLKKIQASGKIKINRNSIELIEAL
jgi:CRP/FNR family transcriptional regulator, anaerobic regulatory protein